MVKYYRNGKAVAEPATPKRTVGNEPKWVRHGRHYKATCRVCGEMRTQKALDTEYDPVMQRYVPVDICRGCASYVSFQDKPELGLWESQYWTGTEDTTGYSISSGTAIENIQHNPAFPCGTRVHLTPCKLEV